MNMILSNIHETHLLRCVKPFITISCIVFMPRTLIGIIPRAWVPSTNASISRAERDATISAMGKMSELLPGMWSVMGNFALSEMNDIILSKISNFNWAGNRTFATTTLELFRMAQLAIRIDKARSKKVSVPNVSTVVGFLYVINQPSPSIIQQALNILIF